MSELSTPLTLIEPVKSGAALADEIASTRPEPGTLCLWWLGQSGLLIKSSQGTLLIDPYLSESLTAKYAATDKPHIRMTRNPIEPRQLAGLVDLVLCSHKHSDHMDPGTLPPLMGANPGAEIGVPESLMIHAEKMGLPGQRLFGLDAGWTTERAGFLVRAIPSAHEGLDTDSLGRHLYLGFVIEAEGRRLYHSGDTVVYPGLIEALGSEPFDLLFLPINGRNPARGVSGNMNAAEAVDLAAAVRPRFVVPHHYDMFTFNTVPVASFTREAERLPAGVAAHVLDCGARWEILP